MTARAIEILTGAFKDPNPILVKELRATFRTALFIRFLYLSTGAVALIVLSGGAMIATGPIPPAEVGQIVFQIFFSAALFVIAFIVPGYAATALTSEKSGRTYESLILSGMDPWRIVRGKFIACTASILLVLVAFAPIAGIAFLFGGISPSHVVLGYWSLFLCLAPTVAFGIALSSRLKSTPVAIMLATVISWLVSPFLLSMLVAIGEAAIDAWGTTMHGPFWFTEAVAARFFELDTFLLAFVLPMFLSAMTTWFFLAAAVAGVRPPAEDRSTAFKAWSIVMTAGVLATAAGLAFLPTSANDSGEVGVVITGSVVVFLLFYALLFANEPPLPPRTIEQKATTWGFFRRALLVFGPGAAPTLRFAVLLIAFTSIAVALVTEGVRFLRFGAKAFDEPEIEAALVVIASGHAVVACFLAAFATWLRTVLRSGIAARVLAIGALTGMIVLPLMLTLIADPDSLDRIEDSIPFLVALSPAQPLILAVNLASEEMAPWNVVSIAMSAVPHAVLALLFWVLVEARVRSVKRDAEARRRAQEERARTSVPSPPLLQRASQPSVPPKPEPAPPAPTEPVA